MYAMFKNNLLILGKFSVFTKIIFKSGTWGAKKGGVLFTILHNAKLVTDFIFKLMTTGV